MYGTTLALAARMYHDGIPSPDRANNQRRRQAINFFECWKYAADRECADPILEPSIAGPVTKGRVLKSKGYIVPELQ